MPEHRSRQIDALLAGLSLALDRRDLSDASALCVRLNAQIGLADAATLGQTAESVKQLLHSARAIRNELKQQLKGALGKRHGANVYEDTRAAATGSFRSNS